MNFVGDEKRIQALFRELRLEDQHVVPEFDRVWNEARVSRSETFALPHRRLRTSLIATAFTLVVMSAMFLFSGSSGRAPEIPELAIVQMSPVIVVNNPEPVPKRRIVRRHETQVFIRDAVALTTWKSPTAIFMETPARSEINSLPQLNQASKELQAFLPGDGRN
jgi:hypothetical protein